MLIQTTLEILLIQFYCIHVNLVTFVLKARQKILFIINSSQNVIPVFPEKLKLDGVRHRTSFGETVPSTAVPFEPNTHKYLSPFCSSGSALMPTDT